MQISCCRIGVPPKDRRTSSKDSGLPCVHRRTNSSQYLAIGSAFPTFCCRCCLSRNKTDANTMHTRTNTHTHTHVCMYATYVCMHVRMHASMCAFVIVAYVHTRTLAQTHTYTHTYGKYTHTHTHIHTHIHADMRIRHLLLGLTALKKNMQVTTTIRREQMMHTIDCFKSP